ncbi:MAG: hypothetical protein AAGB34_09225, partial [Planctomycetota bacterium]
MIRKVLTIAVREFKATALTPAFLISLFFFPVGVFVFGFAAGAISLLGADPKPMTGIVAVADTSHGSVVENALRENYDPENQQRRHDAEKQAADEAARESLGDTGFVSAFLSEEQASQLAQKSMQVRPPAEIEIVAVRTDDDIESARERVTSAEYLALVIATEPTITADTEDEQAGRYQIFRRPDMELKDLDDIRAIVRRAV